MHKKIEITLCSISYFYNVQQQNNYLLYDFSLPDNNKQYKAIKVDQNKLKDATKLEQALEITLAQNKLLEKKRRAYNFILPFKQSNYVTTHLTQLVTQSDGLSLSLESDNFFDILLEYKNLDKLIIHDNMVENLKFFHLLLCQELVREIYIICESQENLVSRFPFCYQNFEFSLPNEIIENQLYLGNSNHANNLKALNLLGITHVVNCAKEIPNYFSEIQQENKDFIKYFQVPVLDLEEEPISDHFDEAYIFINEALNKQENKVLVHCAQGKSRSATIVLMFLMRNKQWSFDQAYEYAKKRREIISINDGFQYQLLQI
ncbi:unnamed protein product [Paramecium pentaurelia]|uniref:protein-tyrosine-phosphatase n=1 Tax=Paramecium pentaurelia TaxID=43138 RepID=A0A8S1U092_9CILI|nr:unnamed protein product [Paramecium pentaurelia]